MQAKNKARASQILRIYSEWEPSAEDMAFISATFPRAEVSYSFARPTSADGWEAAFQEARQTMQAAAEKDAIANMEAHRRQGNAQLFPILRNYDGEDVFTQIGVYRPLNANLAVYLANVGMTPRDTIGIDYVMQQNLSGSAQEVEKMFETAWQNLRTGLQVNVREADGEKLFSFSHPNNMAASVFGLPEFYEQVRSWLGEEVFVAFTDPDNLFVASPDSQFIATLRQAVEQSEYWGSVALTPACYILNGDGLRQVAIRTPKT